MKLCWACFRERFGPDAKVQVLTWSAACSSCQTPTPPYGLLIKVDVVPAVDTVPVKR